MKKSSKIVFITASLFITATLVGCGGGEKPIQTYTVTFNCDDAFDTIPSQTIKHNELVSKPSSPTSKDVTKIFDNFYFNGKVYNFDTPVTSNFTIDVKAKDFYHTITFNPTQEAKDTESWSVKVINTKSLKDTYPTEVKMPEVEPKDSNKHFHAWLDKDKKIYTGKEKVIEDAEIKADFTENWIDISTENENKYNLYIENNKTDAVTFKATGLPDGAKPTFNIIGSEDLITLNDKGDGTCEIKIKEDNKSGESATLYCHYEDVSGKVYDGHIKLAIGTFTKFNHLLLKEGKVDPNNPSIDGDVIIPNDYYVSSNNKWVSVKEIANQQFSGTSISSLYIPSNITFIPNNAFKLCSSLVTVTMSDYVSTIGECSFQGCSKLESITIPKSVRLIGKEAFLNSGLKEADFINKDLWTYSANKYPINNFLLASKEGAAHCLTDLYCDDSFNRENSSVPVININNIVLEKNNNYISHANLFANTDVTYESSDTNVATVEDGYVEATGEGNAEIIVKSDDGKSTICNVKVENSEKLGESQISQKVVHGGIGVKESYRGDIEHAFIPSSIKHSKGTSNIFAIGVDGFKSTTKLQSMYIPEFITTICENAFDGSSINTVIFSLSSKCTTIKTFAFSSCYNLEYINLPESISSIGENAFYNCLNLKKIVLPSNEAFNTLNKNTFCGCSSLEKVIVPQNITIIKEYAFNECSNLKSLTYKGTKSQFESITKEENWKADSSIKEVVCSDGTIIL